MREVEGEAEEERIAAATATTTAGCEGDEWSTRSQRRSELLAHGTLLALRSAHFRSILGYAEKERRRERQDHKNNGVADAQDKRDVTTITITGYSHRSVYLMLAFLYSGI